MKNALQNIRYLRKKAHISQSVLAEKIGMSSTALGKIERGETRLNSEHVSKIAAAIGVSEEQIWFGDAYEEEKLLRENSYNNTRIRELVSENRQLSDKVKYLEELLKGKDNHIRDLQTQLEFARQSAGLAERHPADD